MNMAKGFIKTFPKEKRVTVENGVKIWRLTTAAVLQGDTNWQKKKKRVFNDEFIVVRIPCIDIVHNLTLHIAIRKPEQYFLLQT
jgi:hypothetical protein